MKAISFLLKFLVRRKRAWIRMTGMQAGINMRRSQSVMVGSRVSFGASMLACSDSVMFMEVVNYFSVTLELDLEGNTDVSCGKAESIIWEMQLSLLSFKV